MLKKNDLVKQFELVVKQEIIEHNKFIEANNQAMQSIRIHIAVLEEKITETLNFLKAEIADNKDSMLELFNLIEECGSKTLNASAEMKIKLAKSEDDLKRDITELAKEFTSKSSFSKYREICTDKFDLLSKTIEDTSTIFSMQHKIISNKFSEEFKKYNEKVTEVPITLKKFQKELIKKIEEQKIEKDGVSKEIEVLKKTVFVNEKKIENLYTLIERLNKKLA